MEDIATPVSTTSGKCRRGRALRKANERRAQQRQKRIARGFHMLEPGQDPKPGWRKQKALSCNANCGHCRNPRFNRTVSGEQKLTMAERRTNDKLRQELAAINEPDWPDTDWPDKLSDVA